MRFVKLVYRRMEKVYRLYMMKYALAPILVGVYVLTHLYCIVRFQESV